MAWRFSSSVILFLLLGGCGRNAVRASEKEPVQARVFAWTYAGVGDGEQTLSWLEKAYAEHSGELVSLKVSPAYDFLRNDPRFQGLVERVGLAK